MEGEEDNGSISSTPTHHFSHHNPMPQSEALNLEVNRREANEITNRALETSRKIMEDALGVTPAKRFLTDEVRNPFIKSILHSFNPFLLIRSGS